MTKSKGLTDRQMLAGIEAIVHKVTQKDFPREDQKFYEAMHDLETDLTIAYDVIGYYNGGVPADLKKTLSDVYEDAQQTKNAHGRAEGFSRAFQEYNRVKVPIYALWNLSNGDFSKLTEKLLDITERLYQSDTLLPHREYLRIERALVSTINLEYRSMETAIKELSIHDDKFIPKLQVADKFVHDLFNLGNAEQVAYKRVFDEKVYQYAMLRIRNPLQRLEKIYRFQDLSRIDPVNLLHLADEDYDKIDTVIKELKEKFIADGVYKGIDERVDMAMTEIHQHIRPRH